MPASIAYVLSTRSLSGVLIGEAAAKGVMIDVVPFIDTTHLKDETLTRSLGELIKRPVVAIFTSVNAVTAIPGEERPHWKIFSIGEATRRAVSERFGEHTIAGTANSAKDLAETILRSSPGPGAPKELWFFCGDRRREELPDSLKAAGWRVHEIIVYRTTLTPHRIDKTYDAMVFFSPSAVESFFSMNTIQPHIPLYAIGGTTAAALHRHCPNPITISEKPDEQLLISKLLEQL